MAPARRTGVPQTTVLASILLVANLAAWPALALLAGGDTANAGTVVGVGLVVCVGILVGFAAR